MVFLRSFEAKGGGFSLYSWYKFFSFPGLIKLIPNSLGVGLFTATLTVFLAMLISYTIVKTDVPLRGFFRIVSLMPLVAPPFIIPFSMLLLFGRSGLLTKQLLGLEVSVYGFWGMVIALLFTYLPYAITVMIGVFQSLDVTIEQSARSLGASPFTTFRTVTFNLLKPGILGAFTIVFFLSLTDFATPLILQGSFRVLATEAYFSILSDPSLRMGSVISIILFAICASANILSRRWLGKVSYTTVTGKGEFRELSKGSSPYVKWPLFVICLGVCIFILLVYGNIVLNAFSKLPGYDYTFTLENFKLRQVSGAAAAQGGIVMLRNSVFAATIAGLSGALLSAATAYLVVRGIFPGKAFLDQAALSTFAVPGALLGIGYILAFNKPPLALTGTAAIVILCMIFQKLPLAYQSVKASLMQVDQSIEQASRSLGAGRFTTFSRIVLPLVGTGFTGGLLFAFIAAVNTVSAVIFLVTSEFPLASIEVLLETNEPIVNTGVALATLLMAISFLAFAIIGIIAKKGGGSAIKF
jgi:iron(III) transport system permease protein